MGARENESQDCQDQPLNESEYGGPERPFIIPPPGNVKPSKDVQVLVNEYDVKNRLLVVLRGVREPGTRSKVYYNPEGSQVFVLEGELTFFVSGQQPVTRHAPDVYGIPKKKRVIVYNGGAKDAHYTMGFAVSPGQYASLSENG